MKKILSGVLAAMVICPVLWSSATASAAAPEERQEFRQAQIAHQQELCYRKYDPMKQKIRFKYIPVHY